MPCGGIWPHAPIESGHGWCFHCGKHPTPETPLRYHVEEWDASIHRECLDPFLETEEGKIVVDHGHKVIRIEDQERIAENAAKHKFYVATKAGHQKPWTVVDDQCPYDEAVACAQGQDDYEIGIFVHTRFGGMLFWSSKDDSINESVLDTALNVTTRREALKQHARTLHDQRLEAGEKERSWVAGLVCDALSWTASEVDDSTLEQIEIFLESETGPGEMRRKLLSLGLEVTP